MADYIAANMHEIARVAVAITFMVGAIALAVLVLARSKHADDQGD